MGKIYSQRDLVEHIELDRLRDAGHSLRRIGTLMDHSHTTLSRELRRNIVSAHMITPLQDNSRATVRLAAPSKHDQSAQSPDCVKTLTGTPRVMRWWAGIGLLRIF